MPAGTPQAVNWGGGSDTRANRQALIAATLAAQLISEKEKSGIGCSAPTALSRKKGRLNAVDLIGYGMSDKPDISHDMPLVAADFI